jgi:hypothetical protein
MVVGLSLGGAVLAQDAAPAAAPEPSPEQVESEAVTAKLVWPREFSAGDVKFVIYQPQLETWDNLTLTARAAVAVTPAGKTEPTFGVAWITAQTEIDKSSRLVTLDQIQITKVSFPQAKAQEAEYQAMLGANIPAVARDFPLDQLESNLAINEAQQKAATVEVKNDPPKIIIAKSPGILVLIDGEPSLRAVEGSTAMRIVNTRGLILMDPTSGQYYLHLMNQWVSSPQPTGPWTTAAATPAGFDAIAQTLSKANTIDLLNPAVPDHAPKTLPTVYVSTTPAELIQFTGDPEYTPVTGTNLLYATNTDSAVFLETGTGKTYVLISGRWFDSATLDVPWAYVAGKDLPADFAKIPADSPKANVLVSIPGTQQAKEAVIANSIPQTATVTIADTHLDVTYDGDPKLEHIAGTQGLSYVANTSYPVIYVDSEKAYWAVNNGVWFNSPAATGPWVVSTRVPTVIYTIPVSSPLHYVTYVRIYRYTPTVVYVGYTPGYMGTCVTPSGVVVYGTGYYYPAYVGTVWVGYPPTYGYGAGFACGNATGFAFGFAAGAWMGDCWPKPYWGPCYGYGHVDINSSSVYHNWHGGVTYAHSSYEYNGATGKSLAQGSARTFNPYTGRSSVGGYSNYLDRSDGDFEAKRGGATYNPNTGVVAAGGRDVQGNVYDGNASVNRAGGVYNTNTKSGVGYANGDVYASHDGNVYRHTDDGWQQHSDSGWQDTSRDSFQSSDQYKGLNQDYNSRSQGEDRFNNVSRGDWGGGNSDWGSRQGDNDFGNRSGGGGGGWGGRGGGGWGGGGGGFRGRR